MMTTSRNFVSVRTYALALAVVLSPAMMQTDSLTCAKTGDPTLATLELLVREENHIVAFDPEQLSYDVQTAVCGVLSDCCEAGEQDGLGGNVYLRAYSTDPEAEVMFNYGNEVWGAIDYGWALGGGEWWLSGLLVEGESRLLVSARAPGGATYSYSVNMSVDCDCGNCSGGGGWGPGGR